MFSLTIWEMRLFSLKCKKCQLMFSAKSGASKNCDECRKCKWCGKQMLYSHRNFCSQSCSGKFRYQNNQLCRESINRRLFLKKCDRCMELFQAKTGNRIRCEKCCVCKNCGKQMPNASDDFCGFSCSGKWKYKNNNKVKLALLMGSCSQKRGPAISKAKTGKPRYNMRGIKNHRWKGGVYKTERNAEMAKVEYHQWRRAVFSRDQFKCMNKNCKSGSTKLHAHHVVPWKDNKDKRYDVSNGITVCVQCHKAVHSKNKHSVQF